MCEKIECPYCKKKISRARMNRHIKRKHSHKLETKFECKNCKKLHDATYGQDLFCSERCAFF